MIADLRVQQQCNVVPLSRPSLDCLEQTRANALTLTRRLNTE